MKFGDLISVALSRLGTGKLRTMLTMLGVIIGVASVVALVSVAQGATKGISDRLESLGTNLLTVSPGFSRTAGTVTRGALGSASTLTIDDASAISKLNGVRTIAPQLTVNKLVVAGSQNETARVVGTTSGYMSVFAYSMWTGTFLNDASVENNLRVVVLGSTTADNLGLKASDVNQTQIRIGGLPFELIGIMQSKGGTSNSDDIVLIPVSTAHELFAGTNNVSSIGVSAADQADISVVTAEITALLEQRHGITSSAADDFTITSQEQLLGTVSSVSDVLTFLLAGIASISLLVGGIGIMNIMLVSVRERTREIGIRKAIGARGRDILSQFLVEALALSLAGGIIGIGLGVVASLGIGIYAGWGFVFNPFTVVVALGFSTIVGIVFGVWPASQAASLDPVVALRYE